MHSQVAWAFWFGGLRITSPLEDDVVLLAGLHGESTLSVSSQVWRSRNENQHLQVWFSAGKGFSCNSGSCPKCRGLSIYIPTLTYGHKTWVMTYRMRLWIQMVEMSFFWRVCGLSCRDKVRSSGRGSEESGYSSIWRSQLRLFGHLTRIPPGHFLIEVFQVCPTRKQPHCRPRAHWRDYLSLLGNAFGSPHRMSWRSWQQEGGLGISA